jgi:hypothetical protein
MEKTHEDSKQEEVETANSGDEVDKKEKTDVEMEDDTTAKAYKDCQHLENEVTKEHESEEEKVVDVDMEERRVKDFSQSAVKSLCYAFIKS